MRMELPLSFLWFAVSAAFTPGPNNIMIMVSGLNHGVRASMPHFLGICLGVPLMFLAIGFGLGFVFERFPLLHSIIKVVGIVYLLYLAWLIANATPAHVGDKQTKPLTFLQAALFQWVNPKAWVMGTSAIAAYTTVGADVNAQVLWVALLFFLVAIPSAGSWLVFGVAIQKLLDKPRYIKGFNILMAGLLVASIWPIIANFIFNAEY